MNVSGNRYALQKNHGGRWVTIASSDDLALIEKMLRDQNKHVRRASSWRTLDRAHDKVLTEIQQPAG